MPASAGGLEVYRSRGVFYLWFHFRDGRPHGLGRRIYRSIPQDPTQLAEWIDTKRAELSATLRKYNAMLAKFPAHEQRVDGRYLVVQRTPPNMRDLQGRAKFCYEIDLDYGLFGFQCVPLFHLDGLPSELNALSTMWLCRCTETFWCPALCHDTPRKLQFDLTRVRPHNTEFRHRAARTRRPCHIVDNPNDILSLRDELSDGETIYLRVLEHFVGGYHESRWDVMIQEVGLVDSPDKIGPHGREIALALACTALVPIHLLGPDGPDPHYLSSLFADPKQHCWFVRKHICLALATMLHDERSAQCHVSGLVDAIMAAPRGPRIVYGVMFSLFACIVVRVDTTAGGAFARTKVLDFLPSVYADSWTSPGMALLTRLGHLRAADDVDFFYMLLRPMWWAQDAVHEIYEDAPPSARPRATPSVWTADHAFTDPDPAPAPTMPRLPIDVLAAIAAHIPMAECLFAFALASRATLAASLPRLRLPQLRRAPTRAHAHWPWDLQRSYALGFVLHAALRPDSAYGPSTHGVFACCYRGCAALLEFRLGGRIPARRALDGGEAEDFDGAGMPRGVLVLPTMTGGVRAHGAAFVQRTRVEFEFVTYRPRNMLKQAHRYSCDKPCGPPPDSDSDSEDSEEEGSSGDDSIFSDEDELED